MINKFPGSVFFRKNNGQIFECYVDQPMKEVDSNFLDNILNIRESANFYMIITEGQVEILKFALNDKEHSTIYSNIVEMYYSYSLISEDEYIALKKISIN